MQAAQNKAATACGVIATLPKDGAADIVNSDAVSERSAKRVSPALYYCGVKTGSVTVV